MMIQGVSISEMLSQSITVLTKPSIASFEQFEKRGGTREAFIYMAVGAVAAGIVSFLVGLFSNVLVAVGALVLGIIMPLLSFTVFAYVLYLMGKQQGGTGTQDEVFYSCALYTAPIQAVVGAVSAIPLINCIAAPFTLVAAVYQAYLGYLAARSSMNIDKNKAIVTVVVAIVAQIVVAVVVGGVLTAMLVGSAAVSGGLGR